jgi:hypothetical protein
VGNTGYQQDYPRQGDDRHPYLYGVLRGDTIRFETAEKTGFVYPGIGAPLRAVRHATAARTILLRAFQTPRPNESWRHFLVNGTELRSP